MHPRFTHLTTILPLTLLALALGACDLGGKHCIGDCAGQTDSASTEAESTTEQPDTDSSTTDPGATDGPTTTDAPPPDDEQLGKCELLPTHLGGACYDGMIAPDDICFGSGTFGSTIFDGMRSSLQLPPKGLGTPDLLVSHDDAALSTVAVRAAPHNPGFGDWPSFFLEPLDLVGAADFDGDGDTEVVARTDIPQARVIVLDLDQDNELVEWTSLADIPEMATLDVADWDGDGDADIVATDMPPSAAQARVIVLENDGLGGFDWTLGPLLPFATPQHVLGALDADGKPDDFVFAIGMSIFRHKGGQVQEQHLDFPPNFYVRDLAVADLDHDGLGDIVALVDNTDFNSNELVIALQAAGFAYQRRAVECGAKVLEVVDFDVDGSLDLVVGGDQGFVSIRRNDGAGRFPTLAIGGTIFSPRSLHVSDWDGDGAPDVIALREKDFAITLSEP